MVRQVRASASLTDNAFDAWLSRALRASFDPVLAEPISHDLMQVVRANRAGAHVAHAPAHAANGDPPNDSEPGLLPDGRPLEPPCRPPGSSPQPPARPDLPGVEPSPRPEPAPKASKAGWNARRVMP